MHDDYIQFKVALFILLQYMKPLVSTGKGFGTSGVNNHSGTKHRFNIQRAKGAWDVK